MFKEHRVLCEQQIISVTWIQKKIDIPCEYFQLIYTKFGLCYSINMIPFNQLLSDGYNEMYVLNIIFVENQLLYIYLLPQFYYS